MVAERKIFVDEGLEKYVQHQQDHESEPLKPGVAFPFVKVRITFINLKTTSTIKKKKLFFLL